VSAPKNGAARNAMSPFERQCYDWGWGDNEQRIIELIDNADFHNAITDLEFHLADGNKVVTSNEALVAFNSYRARLLEAIKGEQK
jgi:hypothetical protein